MATRVPFALIVFDNGCESILMILDYELVQQALDFQPPAQVCVACMIGTPGV